MQCGPAVVNATITWLTTAATGGLNPIRIDNANTYDDVISIGVAMANAGVSRSDVFLLSKVGSGEPMGYNDTLQREFMRERFFPAAPSVSIYFAEMSSILAAQGVAYVDAVLIHWPTATTHSSEAQCNKGPLYNATGCRLRFGNVSVTRLV